MRKNLRRARPGMRQPGGIAQMTAAACDVAVSEMTGIPSADLCGFVLVASAHVPGRDDVHRLYVMPSTGFPYAALLLERALADVRNAE